MTLFDFLTTNGAWPDSGPPPSVDRRSSLTEELDTHARAPKTSRITSTTDTLLGSQTGPLTARGPASPGPSSGSSSSPSTHLLTLPWSPDETTSTDTQLVTTPLVHCSPRTDATPMGHASTVAAIRPPAGEELASSVTQHLDAGDGLASHNASCNDTVEWEVEPMPHVFSTTPSPPTPPIVAESPGLESGLHGLNMQPAFPSAAMAYKRRRLTCKTRPNGRLI